MLEAVGVTRRDEQIYRALLRNPRSTAEHLGNSTGLSAAATRGGLRRLEGLGLVTRLPGSPVRFMPARPDAAVDVLVARRREELAQAQAAAQSLLTEMRAVPAHKAEELVEIVVGRQAVARRVEQIVRTTSDEMLMLDRPPYAQVPGEADAAELEALSRGLSWRAVYSPDALEVPDRLAQLDKMRAAGEGIRIHPAVPLKLAVGDRRVAVVPLLDGVTDVDYALVVHASTLVDALAALFDLLWELALPLPDRAQPRAGHGQETLSRLDGTSAQLVTLLAAGLNDKAAARQLGVSPRTFSRLTATLMRTLGARTRFQAGAQAVRRGCTG